MRSVPFAMKSIPAVEKERASTIPPLCVPSHSE